MYQSESDVLKKAEVIFDVVLKVERSFLALQILMLLQTFVGALYISNERNFGVI